MIPSEGERERDFKKGQRSQRTPWEEREDHAEEQDGTLLKQHSAEGDRYQGLNNYLPNKGHFTSLQHPDSKGNGCSGS